MIVRALAVALRVTAASLALFAALGALTPLTLLPSLSAVRTAHSAWLDDPIVVTPGPAVQMARLVNADRAAHGLRAVVYDQALTAVARWRSEDMAARQYISHDIGNVPGLLVFDILRTQGIAYRRAGENLADTYVAAEVAAADAETAMMRSPTHRANILGPDFTHLGIGAAVAPNGRVVFTQLFKTAW